MSEGLGTSSPLQVGRSIGALQSKTYDLAIIGGGMTGASIARYAAAAGLTVALLDAQDYSSGASGKSSKLLDAGLHTMSLGKFGLVKQAMLERKNIQRIAAHLAEPAGMVVPLRGRWRRYALKRRLSRYESLGAVPLCDRRESWDTETLAAAEPILQSEKFKKSVAYREYLTDDARLVLAMLRSAADKGCACANYVRVHSIRRRRDKFFLHCVDELTHNEMVVRARSVVNACGVWAEKVSAGDPGRPESAIDSDKPNNADSQNENSTPAERASSVSSRLQFSKEAYVAVPHDRLPITHLVTMRAADDRVVYAIPRGQVTYIGATDTLYESDPEYWPSVNDEDIHYLLEPLPRYFRAAALSPADVISSWAALRPLIRVPGKSAQELSRKNDTWIDPRGVITTLGGGLLAHRDKVARAIEQVAKVLDRSIELTEPLDLLPGGDFSHLVSDSEDIDARSALEKQTNHIGDIYGLNKLVARRLVGLYGAEVESVLGTAPQPISKSVFIEEVDWAVSMEGALYLEDVIYRRLRSVWFEPQELTELLPAVADRMASLLGWDAQEHSRQRLWVEERVAFDLASVPLA